MAIEVTGLRVLWTYSYMCLTCTHVCVCVCMFFRCAYRVLRRTSGIPLHTHSALLSWTWGRVSYWTWIALISCKLVASKCSNPPVSAPCCTAPWLQMHVGSGDLNLGPCLCGKDSYPLSHHPNYTMKTITSLVNENNKVFNKRKVSRKCSGEMLAEAARKYKKLPSPPCQY